MFGLGSKEDMGPQTLVPRIYRETAECGERLKVLVAKDGVSWLWRKKSRGGSSGSGEGTAE